MNRELLTRIQRILIDLTQAMSAADKTPMIQGMQSLDEIAAKSSPEIPPRLMHFLQQRSYAKAIAWLNETIGASADTER